MSRQTDLCTFAESWLRRPLTSSDAIIVSSSVTLPAALREIYETFGRCRPLTRAHDCLLAPGKIEPRDEYSIFYVENQGVAYWAFKTEDAEADDPIVHQCSDSLTGFHWNSERIPISAWIRYMTLRQLDLGGYSHGAYARGITDAAKIVSATFPEVTRHPDGHTRFYGADGALVCLTGSDPTPSVLSLIHI